MKPVKGRIPSHLKEYRVTWFARLPKVDYVTVRCRHCKRGVVVTYRAVRAYGGETRPCFHCFKTSIVPKELNLP